MMRFIFSVTRGYRSDVHHWGIVCTDLNGVTLVSDYTYKRFNLCDPDHPDHPDESYLVAKVTRWWKLFSDESYLVMKVI